MATVAEIADAVAGESAKIDALIAIVTTFPATLADLEKQVTDAKAAAQAAGADPSALDAIKASIQAEGAKVDAQIAALTPAPVTPSA